MSQAWEDVLKLFAEIADDYLEMIALAEEKREALINVKVEKISKIILQEEALIKTIGALENKRMLLVETIAQENKWTDKRIKLLDLVERAPEEFSEAMKKTGQHLADIVMRIALLNGINNNLLKQAMGIIEYNINILSNAQATPFYDAGGGQPRQDGKGDLRLNTLDRKA
jgi:flagellar biosynthesis/type III secretory pathway chaperone